MTQRVSGRVASSELGDRRHMKPARVPLASEPTEAPPQHGAREMARRARQRMKAWGTNSVVRFYGSLGGGEA